MHRRPRDLTVEALHGLPEPCRACVFWEVGDAPRGPAEGGEAAKEAWIRSVELEWGPPGKVVLADDESVAYALAAPGHALGRSGGLGPGTSDDALLLATLWVNPAYRRAGIGRLLLQALLREAHERGERALEAYGARRPVDRRACVLPVGFLLATGFAVLCDDVRYPLLRLDVRQTVRWQESLSQALDAVLDALPRGRVPSPARPSAG